jgi:hypothetical protein
MKHVRVASISASGSAIALALCAFIAPAQAGQRPLSDFLSRQSTWCMVFTEERIDCAASYYGGPDCLNGGFPITFPLFWGDSETDNIALVDPLGQLDEGDYGTSVTGSISEAASPQGPVSVNVIIRTTNALTRAFDPNFEPLFGTSNPDGPTLGDQEVHLQFTNPALGDPLPDLAQLDSCPVPGQVYQRLSVRARASGPLREASGMPAGTPGRMLMNGTVDPDRSLSETQLKIRATGQ